MSRPGHAHRRDSSSRSGSSPVIWRPARSKASTTPPACKSGQRGAASSTRLGVEKLRDFVEVRFRFLGESFQPKDEPP